MSTRKVRLEATVVAFSGFFLREDSWDNVRGAFARFVCADALRDDPQTTLDGYVDAVLALIAATPPPHVLVAHSFGGWLAAAVAERMAEPPRALVLLGALGWAPGRCAAEQAATAGAGAMDALCRFDPGTGAIRLVDEAAFRRMLGGEGATVPRVSASEPPALLMETPISGHACR